MKNQQDDFDMWIAKIIAKRPNFASEYLEATLEEYKEFKDSKAILGALKQIALAQGIGRIAERAGIPRVTISRALSEKGNPRMDTFMSIIDAMGLNISFSVQHNK
ncbi:MAG: hypothetical protein ABL867_11000 [Rickettsiales bacterium]